MEGEISVEAIIIFKIIVVTVPVPPPDSAQQ
jgi:hypothetical protein